MPSDYLMYDENGNPDMDHFLKQLKKKNEIIKDDNNKKVETKIYSESENGKTIKILFDNFECFKKEAESYPTWFPILCALYNSVENKDEGLLLAHQFSKLNNYDEDGVNKVWEKFESKPPEKKKTIGSLMYLAKKNNEEKYKTLFGKKKEKQESKKNIEIPIEEMKWKHCEEADFAKLYKLIIYKDTEILFTGEEKELEGYMFNGIYYKPLPLHDAELHKKHFDTLYQHYKNGLDKLEDTLDLNNKDHKKFLNFAVTKVEKLNTYNTRNNVIKIFKKDNYKSNVIWNRNENLFVFEDAVYDLEQGKFIKGNPDDFINHSCGLFYNNTYSELQLQTATETIVNFIKSIIHEENYEYLMTLLSSFLKQENKEELAHFWLGNGRNGKGTLAELLQKTLGSYWCELSIDNYTNYEKGKDRPNQNLFNCQNGRVLNTSEVGENINTGFGITFISDQFKRFTGGDTISVRELGTKSVANFKAGKCLIQTNTMPTFSKMDNPLRERIRVIPFPYTFTDDKQKIEKEPSKFKLKDINLKKTLTDDLHRIAFINLLFTHYKQYKVKGLVLTETIKNHTLTYFDSQTLMNWVENNCEENSNSNVALEFIKIKYKEETGKTLSVNQIEKELSSVGCSTSRRLLKGWEYKINPEQDEV
jgi:phage/plasmid-associated DNA primase